MFKSALIAVLLLASGSAMAAPYQSVVECELGNIRWKFGTNSKIVTKDGNYILYNATRLGIAQSLTSSYQQVYVPTANCIILRGQK